jgi:hypothetical protein
MEQLSSNADIPFIQSSTSSWLKNVIHQPPHIIYKCKMTRAQTRESSIYQHKCNGREDLYAGSLHCKRSREAPILQSYHRGHRKVQVLNSLQWHNRQPGNALRQGWAGTWEEPLGETRTERGGFSQWGWGQDDGIVGKKMDIYMGVPPPLAFMTDDVEAHSANGEWRN